MMKQMVALGTKLKSSVSKVGWEFPETEGGGSSNEELLVSEHRVSVL